MGGSTCDRCAAHAKAMGFMETKHACPNCDCGHGIEVCGCAHCQNPPAPFDLEMEGLVEAHVTAAWDDRTQPTCNRCAAHAGFSAFQKTSHACPGCDCGHGLNCADVQIAKTRMCHWSA